MPLKNDVADGDSSFAMGRKYYTETNKTEATLTNKIILKKKYLGGNNRDASSVINRRKNSQIGSGSVNASAENIAFSQVKDYNDIYRTLARMRGSGKTIPPKITGKYVAEYETNLANSLARLPLVNKILIIGSKSGNAQNDVTSLYSNLLAVQDRVLSLYAGKLLLTTSNTTLEEIANYDGADLSLTKYSLVILFTTEQTNTNSIQYGPSFAENLNKFISSGGNIILGNYFFQRQLTQFNYGTSPFLYNNNSNFTTTVLSTLIYKSHPITSGVDTNIAQTPQKIDANVVVNRNATTIVTTTNNIPFLSVYYNPITASKSVAINANLAPASPILDSNNKNIVNFHVLIYNSIYWCLNLI